MTLVPAPENQNSAPRIRVLPDRVANQIAAGEVVERPVAVVKELVENSLDAGATRIFVSFEEGGRRLISVEDDGCGMGPQDAMLSLERHATSKLRDASDLDSVRSFGFRGEALPSIASVSRLRMTTRPEGQAEGTEIVVNNGSIAGTRAVGMARGTKIEVAHLFESVPARRKFLKSDRTESAHIVLMCRLLAAAHPDVAFTLSEDGRVVFRAPASSDLSTRIADVFGRQTATAMVPLDASRDGLRVHGLVSRPGQGRTAKGEVYWFANSRPVDNRALTSTYVEAAEGWMARGSFPSAFLFLEIDPAAIDVNIHPAKREIRLRDEHAVRSFVSEAVYSRMEELARGARPQPETPPATPPPQPAIRPLFPAPKHPAPRQQAPLPPPPAPEHTAPGPQRQTSPATREAEANLPARWRYIGVAHGNHVLFETPDGILCLNLSAALSRVYYEQYMDQLQAGRTIVQNLLFPRLFELPPLLSDVLERSLDFFRDNGFAIEGFGANSFRIVSVPAWFDGEQCESFVREAVEKIAQNGMRPGRDASLAREGFARLACAHAARTHSPADEEQILALVRRLLACRNPLTDPRGRPTYFELSRGELERR